MNVLLMANELRYTCGVTNHLLHLAKGLTDTGKVKLWIACGGGNGINRFIDINVEIISDDVFLHLNRNFSNFLLSINSLSKVIRQNNIQIVHSHSHYSANIAQRAAQLTGAVTVQTNHGILKDPGKLKHFAADRYIAINEHIYDHLLNNENITEDNIEFIRCGIPVPPEQAEKSKEKVKVIAASRFTMEKGLDVFISAVSQLSESTREKAGFYIAGEGPMESDLQELNKRLNAGVNFMGSIKDIYSILEMSHILVYPSRSGSEGFPAIITEAGACGNLVISSDFVGVNSVIEHNTDGLIFPSEDTAALSALLENAVNNFGSYSNHAMRFHEKVKDWYALDKMISKHIDLYNKCLVK